MSEKDTAYEQKVRLWVSTIESLHDLKDNDPLTGVPMAATKLDEVIHILEERFGEWLFETTMERYSTTEWKSTRLKKGMLSVSVSLPPATYQNVSGNGYVSTFATPAYITVKDSIGDTHNVPYGVRSILPTQEWVDERGNVHPFTDDTL